MPCASGVRPRSEVRRRKTPTPVITVTVAPSLRLLSLMLLSLMLLSLSLVEGEARGATTEGPSGDHGPEG